MMQADVVVVGAGLAGLSCALELTARRRGVLLLEGGRVVGGRTSSWDEDGMRVESGLHRVLGFYAAFPDLLRQAGLNVDDIVCWEDEIEIRLPDGRGSGVFGAAPLYNPVGTLAPPYRTTHVSLSCSLNLGFPQFWLSASNRTI